MAVKHEDSIMKVGIDYFRDTLLKTLGLDYKFIDSAPTELIELQIHSLYMDFTFLTTEGFYIHIEFQTTNGGADDLRRFHSYEALLSHKTNKKVITYVIFTGGILAAKCELECGIYTYRVIPIYLSDKDAGEIFRKLKSKKDSGEPFTKEDFAMLSLTPLMHSALSRKDTIKEAVLLAKHDASKASEKTLAILYTLADKFLTGDDLAEIKGVVLMTRLGEMIYNDGVTKGTETTALSSIRNLMETLNLSMVQAMDALKIPQEKREKYTEILTKPTNN